MSQTKLCPSCGLPLTVGETRDLCARCLLKRGMESPTAGFTEADQSAKGWEPPTSQVLAGEFADIEVLELLGRGGMGAVYKARQKQLDRIVALKILPPDVGRDPAFAERFAREAKALARLNQPNIVTLYEFGRTREGGPYYFLMEYVDGLNLRRLMEVGRVAPREALAIVPQVCDALQYAHDQGIVHRDIKPENILLDRRGRVKVADFGLALITGQTEVASGTFNAAHGIVLTEVGKAMGTPEYMAPEQAASPGAIDHRVDIYALGAVFYQMLTGELPGKPLEAPSRKIQVDVRLDEMVLRALEHDPGRRYAQASELKTQVEIVAAEQYAVLLHHKYLSAAWRMRLGYAAVACACLSALIPTIVNLLAPWLIPLLKPHRQMVAAVGNGGCRSLCNSTRAGFAKVIVGKLAVLAGCISVSVWWMRIFIARSHGPAQ